MQQTSATTRHQNTQNHVTHDWSFKFIKHYQGLRTVCLPYKGKAVDLKQIGRELNVRYVIEGQRSMRRQSRMRVNVQLIDAETGNHLWAERFDKPLTDLFDMQDEISGQPL